MLRKTLFAAGLTALLAGTVPAAAGAAAGPLYNCRASAIRGLLLGGKITEPVIANPPTSPCVSNSAGAPLVDTTPIPASTRDAFANTRIDPGGTVGINPRANSGTAHLDIGSLGNPAIGLNGVTTGIAGSCAGSTPVFFPSDLPPDTPAGQFSHIASVTLGGQPIPLDQLVSGLAKALNGLGLVHIDTNTVAFDASGLLTARALRVQVLPVAGGNALLDLTVAEAQLGTTGNPCVVPNSSGGLTCPPNSQPQPGPPGSALVCVIVTQVPGTGNPSAPCPANAGLAANGACLVTQTVNPLTGVATGGTLVPISSIPLSRIPGPCRRMNLQDAIIGTPGPDRITGTGRNDLILGLGGRDVIAGGGGNVCIDDRGPGVGNENLTGGPGNDVIIGGRGHNLRINAGGPGRDLLIGGRGINRITGGPGNDHLIGGPFNNTFQVSRGNNHISGGPRRNFVAAGYGHDVIDVRRGHNNYINASRFGKTTDVFCNPRHDVVRVTQGKRRRLHNCRFVYIVTRAR